jgi:hypothetical protein
LPLNKEEREFENLLYGDEEDYYNEENQSIAEKMISDTLIHPSSMKHHHLDATTTIIFNS